MFDAIAALIRDEQRRQPNLLGAVAVDEYLAKLRDRAEVVCCFGDGRCRGLVAFYCNDQRTRQGYITMVIVDPRDRGLGLGRSLVGSALDMMKRRGLTSCRLEVAHANRVAASLYTAMGFQLAEAREQRDLLEIAL